VHEAYVRLVDGTRLDWQGRTHFFGSAARAMRQILVDHARRRIAEKRGGGWERVTLDEDLGLLAVSDAELLDLDDVLTRLGEHDERMSRIVELRVFGGLTGQEIGHALGISRQTVQEEWKVAKMWLRHQLAEGDGS
jgi:RNA polymerase sigma factor (TIGR02999 family)